MKNSILIILAIFLFQNACNAQTLRKNTIGTSLDMGAHKVGVHLEYQRRLTKNFGLVGSLGERSYSQVFSSLKSGKIVGRVLDFGLGVQFSQRVDGSGFFMEGGLNYSRAQWQGSGKIRLPNSYLDSSTLGGFILNLLFFSSPNYETLKGNSEQSSFNPYGKLGHRFVNGSGKFSFGLYIKAQSIPGENELKLTSSRSEKTHLIDTKKGMNPFSLGMETSVRF